MALPKRRHSRTRGRKRRTHYKATAPNPSACPTCGAPRLPHRVCMNCGTYKSEQVVEVEE